MKSILDTLTDVLDKYLKKKCEPKDIGFVLLTIPMGPNGGPVNYRSNIREDDMKELLRTVVEQFDKRGLH